MARVMPIRGEHVAFAASATTKKDSISSGGASEGSPTYVEAATGRLFDDGCGRSTGHDPGHGILDAYHRS